jgi:hypothetical protein
MPRREPRGQEEDRQSHQVWCGGSQELHSLTQFCSLLYYFEEFTNQFHCSQAHLCSAGPHRSLCLPWEMVLMAVAASGSLRGWEL